MSAPPDAYRITDAPTGGVVASTRHGIIERLADPHLTDHDRWVLRQFARFLSGITPEPDPRVARARPERPLHLHVRRQRV